MCLFVCVFITPKLMQKNPECTRVCFSQSFQCFCLCIQFYCLYFYGHAILVQGLKQG